MGGPGWGARSSQKLLRFSQLVSRIWRGPINARAESGFGGKPHIDRDQPHFRLDPKRTRATAVGPAELGRMLTVCFGRLKR
jgi:hypothetical protein